LPDILEKDAAVGSCCPYPIKLGPPIVNTLDQTRECVLAKRKSDEDFDLVAVLCKPQIKRGEISGLANT
jgi:hypothetical protein